VLHLNNTARKEGIRQFLNRISFARLRKQSKKLAKRQLARRQSASISQIQDVNDAHPQRDIPAATIVKAHTRWLADAGHGVRLDG
jgi:hypothetical protein